MNLVRGIAACAVLAAVGAAVGACGPIGVLQSRAVEAGTVWMSALDGHVKFNAPAGTTQGEPRVSFRRGPIPADRRFSPGVFTVGDMVSMDVEGGSIARARITLGYGDLPPGLNPEMLTLFGWSADLGGWVPLTGTVTDAVERAVSGDTILFDGFVVGSWKVTSDVTGDAITTGAGTILPVKQGTSPTFWAYARSAAASSLTASVHHLTGTTTAPTTATPPSGSPTLVTKPPAAAKPPAGADAPVAANAPAPSSPAPPPAAAAPPVKTVAATPDPLVCTPAAPGVTVQTVSIPAGRFDACVVSSGTGTRQLTVRNRFPFPLILDLPVDGRVKPVLNTEAPAGSGEAVDGIRDTMLTYLAGGIAVGGGQTVALDIPPGAATPLRLTGRLDWSAIALDAGLRQLDLLLPSSKAMRPITADALLQAHAEFGPAAVKALAEGRADDQAVQALLRKAGLTGAEQSVADLFQFSACVLTRTENVTGTDEAVLTGLRTTGPMIVQLTSDCLSTIYDKYLPPGSRSAGSLLDTLKATTTQVRHAVPRTDRRPNAGRVTITVTSR